MSKTEFDSTNIKKVFLALAVFAYFAIAWLAISFLKSALIVSLNIQPPLNMIIAPTASSLLMALVGFFSWKRFGVKTTDNPDFVLSNKIVFHGLLAGLGSWILVTVLVWVIRAVSGVENTSQQAIVDALLSPLGLFVVAVTGFIVPFGEEMFFRVGLLSALSNFIHVRWAILIQAIAFGLIHGSLIVSFGTFIFGLILAFFAIRYSSFLIAVTMHITFNAMSIGIVLSGLGV